MKKCPSCFQLISEAATKCRYCSREQDPNPVDLKKGALVTCPRCMSASDFSDDLSTSEWHAFSCLEVGCQEPFGTRIVEIRQRRSRLSKSAVREITLTVECMPDFHPGELVFNVTIRDDIKMRNGDLLALTYSGDTLKMIENLSTNEIIIIQPRQAQELALRESGFDSPPSYLANRRVDPKVAEQRDAPMAAGVSAGIVVLCAGLLALSWGWHGSNSARLLGYCLLSLTIPLGGTAFLLIRALALRQLGAIPDAPDDAPKGMSREARRVLRIAFLSVLIVVSFSCIMWAITH